MPDFFKDNTFFIIELPFLKAGNQGCYWTSSCAAAVEGL